MKKAHEKEKRQKEESILTISDHRHAIKRWLMDFSWAVRERNFQAARELYSECVIAYECGNRRVRSAEELQKDEWEKVWPRIADFQFNLEEMDFFHDEHMAHVAITWSSLTKKFGAKFRRNGRASLLLIGVNGKLKCAASHFSLDP